MADSQKVSAIIFADKVMSNFIKHVFMQESSKNQEFEAFIVGMFRSFAKNHQLM